MRRFLSAFPLALLCLAPGSAALAVPDREAPPNPHAFKSAKLNELDKNTGARFGDWVVWRYDNGGSAILLVHPHTGLVVYMPWSSNGWLNYRVRNGQWYVLFSQGTPDAQKRDDLQVARFIDERPDRILEPGRYAFERWNVTVSGDTLEFHNTGAHHDKMNLRAFAAEFTHNGRLIGGKN